VAALAGVRWQGCVGRGALAEVRWQGCVGEPWRVASLPVEENVRTDTWLFFRIYLLFTTVVIIIIIWRKSRDVVPKRKELGGA
jgi:hypothetical protein